MITLTIVHGDIEDAEEQDTLSAITKMVHDSGNWRGTTGTNDTTAWTMAVAMLDEDLSALLVAASHSYPHWRVLVASTSGRTIQ